MKTLKKISLRSASEFLSDSDLKIVLGGYSNDPEGQCNDGAFYCLNDYRCVITTKFGVEFPGTCVAYPGPFNSIPYTCVCESDYI